MKRKIKKLANGGISPNGALGLISSVAGTASLGTEPGMNSAGSTVGGIADSLLSLIPGAGILGQLGVGKLIGSQIDSDRQFERNAAEQKKLDEERQRNYRIESTKNSNPYGSNSTFGCGGYLKKMLTGGDLKIYNAPTHENGGQMIDENMNPTMDSNKAVAEIEKDETAYDFGSKQYAFSPNLVNILSGRTFAEDSRKIDKKFKRSDDISQSTKKAELKRLSQSNDLAIAKTEELARVQPRLANGGEFTPIDPPTEDELKQYEEIANESRKNVLDLLQSKGYQNRLKNEVEKSKKLDPNYKASYDELYNERLNRAKNVPLGYKDLSDDLDGGTMGLMNPSWDYGQGSSDGDAIPRNPKAYVDYKNAVELGKGLDKTVSPKYVGIEELIHSTHVPTQENAYKTGYRQFHGKSSGMHNLNITPHAYSVINELKKDLPDRDAENYFEQFYLGNPTEVMARKNRLEQYLIDEGQMKAGDDFNDTHYDYLMKNNPEAFQEILKVSKGDDELKRKNIIRLFQEVAMNQPQQTDIKMARKGGKINKYPDGGDLDPNDLLGINAILNPELGVPFDKPIDDSKFNTGQIIPFENPQYQTSDIQTINGLKTNNRPNVNATKITIPTVGDNPIQQGLSALLFPKAEPQTSGKFVTEYENPQFETNDLETISPTQLRSIEGQGVMSPEEINRVLNLSNAQYALEKYGSIPKNKVEMGDNDEEKNSKISDIAKREFDTLKKGKYNDEIGWGLKLAELLGSGVQAYRKPEVVETNTNPYEQSALRLMKTRGQELVSARNANDRRLQQGLQLNRNAMSFQQQQAMNQSAVNDARIADIEIAGQEKAIQDQNAAQLAEMMNNFGVQQVNAKNLQEDLQSRANAKTADLRRAFGQSVGNAGEFLINKDAQNKQTQEALSLLKMKYKNFDLPDLERYKQMVSNGDTESLIKFHTGSGATWNDAVTNIEEDMREAGKSEQQIKSAQRRMQKLRVQSANQTLKSRNSITRDDLQKAGLGSKYSSDMKLKDLSEYDRLLLADYYNSNLAE